MYKINEDQTVNPLAPPCGQLKFNISEILSQTLPPIFSICLPEGLRLPSPVPFSSRFPLTCSNPFSHLFHHLTSRPHTHLLPMSLSSLVELWTDCLCTLKPGTRTSICTFYLFTFGLSVPDVWTLHNTLRINMPS